MKRPLDKPAPALGTIRADEIAPFVLTARKLGWCEKSRRHAKAKGLQTIRFGRFEYVTGQAILDFFRAQADAQASGNGEGGNGDAM